MANILAGLGVLILIISPFFGSSINGVQEAVIGVGLIVLALFVKVGKKPIA